MKTGLNAPIGRRRGARGFSLIEVLFAIGMLGIGIVGVLALFTTGINAASWSKNMTTASMEAQSLYTRLVSEVDLTNKRIFLNRINDPAVPTAQDPDNEWIHQAGNLKEPCKVDPERDLWWQCRVSKFQMDPDDPLDGSKDKTTEKPHPVGLYQVAIAVYRNGSETWKPREPIVVYTTFVTAGY